MKMRSYKLVIDFGKPEIPNFQAESDDLLLIGRAYVELKRRLVNGGPKGDIAPPKIKLYSPKGYEIRDFERRYGPRLQRLAEL